MYIVIARNSERAIKRGTHRFHVGISSAGYHKVWRQWDKQPVNSSYEFSFWAFDRLKEGTIPYAFTCYNDDLNNDCAIIKLHSENKNKHYMFRFYAYNKEFPWSQEIPLKSKTDTTKNENLPETTILNTYLSLWVPKFGKTFGIILIHG